MKRSSRRRVSALNRPEIFVQIPAYRDSELSATLIDLYQKAAHPDRLRVSVLWQRHETERLADRVRKLPRLDVIEIPFEQSGGCNWARSQVQKRWNGEPYTMLIDSHHRFAADWDETLVGMHSDRMDAGITRPLITAYMPRYDPLLEPGGRQRKPYKIYPQCYEEGLLIHLTSYPIPDWQKRHSPVPADFASGHFIFADGAFNRDVPMDPDLYFTGDEVAISVRAYTCGYDLFHPHVVVGWHCYDRASRTTHWTDHSTWAKRHSRALARLRRLFSGRLPGRFGLGRARSLDAFKEQLLMPLIEAR